MIHNHFIRTRAFRKNIIREILKTLNRFLAILAIVALGVGFLAGLLATTPDMRYSTDKYYDETSTMDIRVISTLGLTDDDVNAIKSLDSIDTVLPAYSADVMLVAPSNDTIVTKIHSLNPENDNYLNKVVLLEGRLPQNENECVIEHRSLLNTPINIGDKFTVSSENENIEDKLSVKELEVVGVVKSAYYFSVERESTTVGNGTISLIMYTPESSFSYKTYTDIFVTVKGAKDIQAFSNEYDNCIADATDDIESIKDTQIKLRYDNIIAEATEKLNDAKDEYNSQKEKADEELQKALDKINDGKLEIQNAQKELDNGYNKLNSSQTELDKKKADFNTTIAEKQKQIDDSKLQIESEKEKLKVQKTELDKLAPQIEAIRPMASSNADIAKQVAEYDKNVIALSEYSNKLTAMENSIIQGQKELDNSVVTATNEFKNAQKKIDDAKAELDNNKQKLEDSKTELQNGINEYNENKEKAETELSDAKEKLDDAEEKINEIEMPKWYILDRHYNLGYESFNSNSEKVEAIAKVFPIFFFLVAALVALTTMTRLVEEERTQIGTFKALGYSKWSIISKYLIYAGLASVIGSILGLCIGFKLFPTVIWNAYTMMYNLPPLFTQFNVKYALISSLAAILCTLIATLFACFNSLMEVPARLMQPRAPKAGKRVFLEYITPIWKRMKFTHKVTARNLIRYKKRFFMTVIGIAGCTALLVTGFGLRDSIGDIISKQFNDIFKYNIIVNLKTSDAINENYLKDLITDKDKFNSYTMIYQEKSTATSNFSDRKITATITCIENDDVLNDYIVFRERTSGKVLHFDSNTILVTEKLAEQLGLKVGSKFTLENSDKESRELIVGGITENYLNSYVYIPHNIYEETYGKDIEYNVLIGITAKNDNEFRDTLSTDLLKDENISAVNFTDILKDQFDNLLSKIDYIVIVLIISAGLLAFIVLYNLININITERQKEIATIKVLGFYDKEVASYVYRETIILSIIGTLCGLVMGIFLHAFVVKTAEVDVVMFGRNIYPSSFIISALMTMFFSILVNLVMNKKLKNINMVESMKSNE